MLTGINFSPPLYFLFNFFIQLIYPTSIETLRVQSLVWTLIGVILSFLLSRKVFGSLPACIGTILVLSHSSLLLSQSQEARHYTMLFAFAAWVLLMQSSENEHSKKKLLLTFLAHFCLCQIHYLGIIFSGLAGLSLLISNKKKKIINRIPCHILFSWLLTIPTHVFLLSNQSSHLNTWPKPNGLADLLASYNDSIFFISIVIPIASFLMIKSYMDKKQPFPKDTTTKNATVITTSILWLVAPTLFWILSHISELNLFVDRYFIPKEVAVIVLSAWIVNILLTTIPKISSANTVKYTTTCFCSALILVSTKRASFGLRKETNYHHSLIIEDPLPVENQPIVLRGDPSYFPNAYLGKNDYIFYLQNNSLNKTYKSFSKKIKINFECRKN
jgi:hypothetical protein